MPRNITITFEDGTSHAYQGVPDDVTPDMVQGRALKEFGKGVTNIDGGSKVAAPEPESALESPIDMTGKSNREQSAKVGAGLVRGAIGGASNIGNTLLKPLNFTPAERWNREREAELQSANAAAKEEYGGAYSVGEFGAELAGSAGAGGALGKAATALGAKTLGGALSSSGMAKTAYAGEGAKATIKDLMTRAAGGAGAGAAGQALTDDGNFGMGAGIGAGIPLVGGTLGKGMSMLSNKGAAPEAINAARSAGYVLTPEQAGSSPVGTILNALGGKAKTEQLASLLNKGNTQKLAQAELGIENFKPETLKAARDQAFKSGYEPVINFGEMKGDKQFITDLSGATAEIRKATQSFPTLARKDITDVIDGLKQQSFDSDHAISAIRLLRKETDKAYRTGDATAGESFKKAAKAIEEVVDRNLSGNGGTGLIDAYRSAREQIAKTYSIEKALNKGTNEVTASGLKSQMNKGKPLSGGLKDIAQMGNAFGRSAQDIAGSNAYSIFDAGIGSAAHATLPTLAGLIAGRPIARNIAVSPTFQKYDTILRDAAMPQSHKELMARTAVLSGNE